MKSISVGIFSLFECGHSFFLQNFWEFSSQTLLVAKDHYRLIVELEDNILSLPKMVGIESWECEKGMSTNVTRHNESLAKLHDYSYLTSSKK